MTAEQDLEEGDLGRAIERQTAEVRARPSDARARSFLFELLGFAGHLERAGRQLDAAAHLLRDDPEAQAGVTLCRHLVEAEARRARLFSEGLRPRFVLEPPADVALHLEAADLLRGGRFADARGLLDRASEARGPRPGALGDAAFGDFRDADDLLAPVLEVFAPGGYFWVPWEHVQYLEVGTPRALRDLLWAPARLALFDGQLGEVHLPALYPGSAAHPDAAVRLGRRTDWSDAGGGVVRGSGLKTFAAGDDARTLFELAAVRFEPPAAAAPGPAREAAS